MTTNEGLKRQVEQTRTEVNASHDAYAAKLAAFEAELKEALDEVKANREDTERITRRAWED